jgi:hypothetical protein
MNSESICAGWITLNYSLYQLSIFLMIWTSIERYLFIYYEPFILRHIILLHYGPIAILSLYCSVLYVGIVLLYTCQPAYNVQLYLCGGPCYLSEPFLGMFDWVGNGISMELGTLLINIILIIRHLIQRYRMRHSMVTTAGRQQWVRDCPFRFVYSFRILAASIGKIIRTIDWNSYALHCWLDSLLNHCTYADISKFGISCLYSFIIFRLFAIFTSTIVALCLHHVYA